MKDIRIKWKWIKRELLILVVIYLFVNLLNIFSILLYNTNWGELFSSQGYVLFFTEWLYLASIVVRLLLLGLSFLMKKK